MSFKTPDKFCTRCKEAPAVLYFALRFKDATVVQGYCDRHGPDTGQMLEGFMTYEEAQVFKVMES